MEIEHLALVNVVIAQAPFQSQVINAATIGHCHGIPHANGHPALQGSLHDIGLLASRTPPKLVDRNHLVIHSLLQ